MMREAFPEVHYEYDTDALIADETGVVATWTASALTRVNYSASSQLGRSNPTNSPSDRPH